MQKQSDKLLEELHALMLTSYINGGSLPLQGKQYIIDQLAEIRRLIAENK